MSINEIKIKAFNKLLSEGVISSKEYSKIIAVLSEGEKEVNEKTPAEKLYESYMKNNVAQAFKSPSSVKFPPLESSMIEEENLSIMEGFRFKKQKYRYIRTYVDAHNSYGAELRHEMLVVIDDNFNPLFVLNQIEGPFGGKKDHFIKMKGVK